MRVRVRHLGVLLLSVAALTGIDVLAADEKVSRPDEWATPMTAHEGLGNFFKVSDALYRGEQPDEAGFASLKAAGIRTVVNLRTLRTDKEGTKENGLKYFHITFQPWNAENEEVAEFLRIVTDPENQPVFVHCRHGADRTGVMVAAYRIVVQGWSREDAIEEMTKGGFGFHSVWQNLVDYVEELEVEAIRSEAGVEAPE